MANVVQGLNVSGVTARHWILGKASYKHPIGRPEWAYRKLVGHSFVIVSREEGGLLTAPNWNIVIGDDQSPAFYVCGAECDTRVNVNLDT